MNKISEPRVSVIIPLFNAESYIGEAIGSVLKQTLSDFELLIINDGSTDKSLNICRKIEDSRIKIVTQQNEGLSSARNKGICLAVGEFIAFLDADDFWDPGKLAWHLRHFERHNKTDFSFKVKCNIMMSKLWSKMSLL